MQQKVGMEVNSPPGSMCVKNISKSAELTNEKTAIRIIVAVLNRCHE